MRLATDTLVSRLSRKRNKCKPCPHCQSTLTVKHGKREIKRTTVQVYKCNTCNRFFSDRKVKGRSYDAKTIMRAVTYYNLGYTMEQTKREMAKRFHRKIPLSTLRSWIKGYAKVCRFARLRKEAVKLFGRDNMVFSHSLQHNQVYNYQMHNAKLALVANELPQRKFSLLASYLRKIPTQNFPHYLFQHAASDDREDGNITKKRAIRASQVEFDSLDFMRLSKRNFANALASLALHLAKTNRQRHEAIQSFMTANDSVTVACEVPVYLTGDDIRYYLSKGFTLDLENCKTPVTGHIDILQIRNGLIHILDYKPGAERIDATSQLTIYALALASRTGLAVKDLKCAWFDDKNYYEFFSLHAVYRKRKRKD